MSVVYMLVHTVFGDSSTFLIQFLYFCCPINVAKKRNMANKKAEGRSVYKVRVVYGIEKKLKIVLLGE